MSLIDVTGLPGAGKSAVCHELASRGFRAFDADEGDISEWYDRKTNEPVSEATVYAAAPDAWFAMYDLRLCRAAVEKLVPKAKADVAFLCGAKPNKDEVRDLFDHVCCLALDTETIKRRLATRTSNNFGKDAGQLDFIISQHDAADKFHQAAGSVMIDASKPLPAVVDAIIKTV